jgi:vWA-MoxR associated protein C-terminal domain/Effector-associated domain 1/vWA-MoxR associated protein middle region (VMAP-M) 1
MGQFELDGSQIEALGDALSKAFKEPCLKQMLRLELNWHWDEIKDGLTYEDRLFNLIEKAESEGKVAKLLISAAKRRSQNSEIQNFFENNIDQLIEFDVPLLTKERLLDLLTIFKKASDFKAIGELVRCILPRIETHCSQELAYVDNSDLANWFKGFTVLKLLLEDYPKYEQHPSILIFVKHLLKEEKLDTSINQQLNEWLRKIDPNFNDQDSKSEQTGSGTLQAYLMIMVHPEKKNQVRAIASLLCISTGSKKETPVHLNPESNERGELCTRKKLPGIIEKFIKKSVDDELDNLVNTLGCANYNLTIELFLPINYLGEAVDSWKIKNDWNNLVHLGCQYRLVVRSYERAVKPGLKNAFSKSWHSAKNFLEQQPNDVLLQQKIQHLDNINCNQIRLLKEELKRKIGLKVSCALPESEPERIKFFQAIIESGVPIAFWTRCRELPSSEVIAGIDQFLTTKLLLNSCELLEKVRENRASAFYCATPENHWGSHLSVLWDDLERMPTLQSF